MAPNFASLLLLCLEVGGHGPDLRVHVRCRLHRRAEEAEDGDEVVFPKGGEGMDHGGEDEGLRARLASQRGRRHQVRRRSKRRCAEKKMYAFDTG